MWHEGNVTFNSMETHTNGKNSVDEVHTYNVGFFNGL